MGSKQALLPFITQELSRIHFQTAMDAFSGSGCVAYALKQAGKKVIANDFLKFAYHIAKATVENSGTLLDTNDVRSLIRRNGNRNHFIQEKYSGLYFSEIDCEFLDNVRANVDTLKSRLKRSIALAALSRACMKKRPRGLFTFVGRKGWDGRRDLRLSMKDQFLNAVQLFNAAVFSNRQLNRALCMDVFETPRKGIDLVYVDSPYVSPHSDCDYTRRYHFVEGLCAYWDGMEIQENTVTKKIKSYPTPFSNKSSIDEAFYRLFEHFNESIIVVSYGSNGYPKREAMVRLLREFKRKVRVAQVSHKYCVGNHRHKVDDNNNQVMEYLFVAE
jgi:DNA adenine methylase